MHCVHDVLHNIGGMDPANPNHLFYQIQPSAIEALQEAAEAAIIGEFKSMPVVISLMLNYD